MTDLLIFLTAGILGYAYAAMVIYALWVGISYYYTNKR